jgi:hypothetical protein
MRSTLAALLLGTLVCAAACGSDDSSPPDTTPDAGLPALDPAPPEGGQQLASDPYTLAAGEERYICQTFTSPADAVGITEVQPISGQLVHHVALFQTFGGEPDGQYECDVLVKFTWRPVWAGGTGGNGLVMPDGVGMKIEPDTQYLVQLHLQNTTDGPITERSGINLRYSRDPALIPAGIYALGQFSLEIPAMAQGFTQTTECDADKEMHVFAVFPHMHKLGKKLEFMKGPSASEMQPAYTIDPWPFGDQPLDKVDLTVMPGEHLKATCTWDNPYETPIMFGESSDDEMCIFVLFYYPFDGLGGCGF